jgi:ariadne-1
MASPVEYDDYGAIAAFSPSAGAITVIPTAPEAADESHALIAAGSSGNSGMLEALMRRSRVIAESLFVHPNVAFVLLAKQSWHERQLFDQWPALAAELLKAIGLTHETRKSDLLLRQAALERTAECLICSNESDNFWGLPCGHFFCRDCWEEHIRIQMDHACYLVPCPGQCPFKLPPESVVHIVGAEMYNQFLEHLRDDQVSRSVSLTHCPNPHCSAPVDQVPWPCDFLKCTRCSFEFCRASGCEQCQSHAPATCAEKAIWASVTDDDLMFQRAAGTAYKKCPKCSVPIYRWTGCDHMTCSRCHHEFCFICFADWHPSHYGCTRPPPEQAPKRDIETVSKDLVDMFNDPFLKLRTLNATAHEKHDEIVSRLVRALPKDHEDEARREVGRAL